MTASEIRAQLHRLHWEMLEAESAGLGACAAYMRDLQNEISECRAALVGASVIELAVARAERAGPLVG
jgi:hypothetical protein